MSDNLSNRLDLSNLKIEELHLDGLNAQNIILPKMKLRVLYITDSKTITTTSLSRLEKLTIIRSNVVLGNIPKSLIHFEMYDDTPSSSSLTSYDGPAFKFLGQLKYLKLPNGYSHKIRSLKKLEYLNCDSIQMNHDILPKKMPNVVYFDCGDNFSYNLPNMQKLKHFRIGANFTSELTSKNDWINLETLITYNSLTYSTYDSCDFAPIIIPNLNMIVSGSSIRYMKR